MSPNTGTTREAFARTAARPPRPWNTGCGSAPAGTAPARVPCPPGMPAACVASSKTALRAP
eukprot:6522268-Lingulodinium_polyedra.AAC.1